MTQWDDDASRTTVAKTLAKLVQDPGVARVILATAEVPTGAVPGMQGIAPVAFWNSVSEACQNGINAEGLEGLVRAALEIFPHNREFLALRGPAPNAARVAGPVSLAFVAANPATSERLALAEEWRAIADHIARSRNARNIAVKLILAATPQTILDELLGMPTPPAIVHFAGHGTDDGHLILQGPADGSEREASRKALRGLLAAVRDREKPIGLVMLNACYSATFLEELTREVDAALGWVRAIADFAASAFSSGLYAALANGRSVGAAVAAGRALMSMEGFGGFVDAVCLKCRPGLDPDDLVLMP